MKEITLNRLRLGKQFVGYRVNVMEGSNRSVSFDVSNDYIKSFLKIFRSKDIKKGVVIDGKLVNGIFVTPDEKDVYEVSSLEQGVELLNKYYFCNTTVSNDILNITETPEEAAIRKEQEYQAFLDTLITGKRLDLNSLEFGHGGDVGYVYGYLEKASNGVKCDFRYHFQPDKDTGKVYLECHFIDLREMIKFVHNLLGLLNRKNWTILDLKVSSTYNLVNPDVHLQKGRIPRIENQKQFVTSVLKRFGLNATGRIIARDVLLHGRDTGGDIEVQDDSHDTFILSYKCEVPGYERHWSGSLERTRFFYVGGGI